MFDSTFPVDSERGVPVDCKLAGKEISAAMEAMIRRIEGTTRSAVGLTRVVVGWVVLKTARKQTDLPA